MFKILTISLLFFTAIFPSKAKPHYNAYIEGIFVYAYQSNQSLVTTHRLSEHPYKGFQDASVGWATVESTPLPHPIYAFHTSPGIRITYPSLPDTWPRSHAVPGHPNMFYSNFLNIQRNAAVEESFHIFFDKSGPAYIQLTIYPSPKLLNTPAGTYTWKGVVSTRERSTPAP